MCWRFCGSGDYTEAVEGKLESLRAEEGSGRDLSLPFSLNDDIEPVFVFMWDIARVE